MESTREYLTEKPASDSGEKKESIWIAGMRIVAWISFIVTIIGGLIAGIGTGSGGMAVLAVFIASISGFIVLAGIMIFLNIATDISEIKRILKNKE